MLRRRPLNFGTAPLGKASAERKFAVLGSATGGVVVISFGMYEIGRHPIRPCQGRGSMRRIWAWLSFSLCAALFLIATAAAQSGRLIFLSTQLRPIEEAHKMRNLILNGYRREVDYITALAQQFPVRIKEEEQSGTHIIDVVGALHGEADSCVYTLRPEAMALG
jgi:hypothetical protein